MFCVLMFFQQPIMTDTLSDFVGHLDGDNDMHSPLDGVFNDELDDEELAAAALCQECGRGTGFGCKCVQAPAIEYNPNIRLDRVNGGKNAQGETPDPALLPTATICVKRPSGETRLMDCRPYVTTVLDVKTFMLERGGHPILLQVLVHGGKVLEDNKSLCECEITKDHTIHLHLLCGSGPRPSSPTAGSAPQAKKRHLETNLEESGGAGERAEKRLKAGVDYRGFPIPRVSYIDTTQIEHRCTLEND
jgi:hypothetical protein